MYILICVSGTTFMLAYWGVKFSLDEDLTVITYRKFYGRKNDVHPTLSICLRNPFFKQRLAEYGVNYSSYLDFLKGEYFSEDMLQINYKNVTIDISDHIKGYRMYFRNGTYEMDIMDKSRLIYNNYNGFDNSGKRFMKCFSLNIPRIHNLQTFRILISNNLFEQTKCERPTNKDFKAFFHIPRQFLISGDFKQIAWPNRSANESYKTSFRIGDITIMKTRSKRKFKCRVSEEDYDHWVMELQKNEIKCNIPYLKLDPELPMCNNKELMKRGLINFRRVTDNRQKPCETMENIDKEFHENTIKANMTTRGNHVGEFWLSVTYRTPKFKEFEQRRYLTS